MAQLAISVVGAAAGFVIGGPAGAQVGWVVGSLVGSQFGPKQNTQGPRLSDLKVTSGAYGDVIPWAAGHPRVAGQVWWASSRREVSQTTEQGKGGGPTSTTYTYVVDVLFGLVDREILTVARIWSNGKLIWTAHADSDTDSQSTSQNDAPWDRMTIYTGSASQLPDPAYEAVVGVGNAPAYRGRGSVFIEGLQLGNSGVMPNLTFEVVIAGAVTFTDRGFLSHFESMADATHIVAEIGPDVLYTPGLQQSVKKFGTSATQIGGSAGPATDPVYSVSLDVWNEHWRYEGWAYWPSTAAASVGLCSMTNSAGTATFSISLVDRSVYPYDAPFNYNSTNNIFVGGGGTVPPPGGASASMSRNTWFHWALQQDKNGTLRLYANGGLYAEWGTAGQQAFGPANVPTQLAMSNTIYIDETQYRTFDDDADLYTGPAYAVPTEPFPTPPYAYSVVTPYDDTLQNVVEALCERAGMPPGTYDATSLAAITKPVRSLAVGQVTSARAVLEQLVSGYFFECYATDKLYFVPRAGTVADAIESDDLATGNEQAEAETLPMTIGSNAEIAAQVAVSYANVDADYNTATEHSDRLLTGQVNTSNVQLPLGFTSAEAKGIADAMVIDGYASRIEGQMALPVSYAELVPTTIVTVPDDDGNTYRVRIVRRTDELNRLTFDWVLDDASAIESAGITSDDYTPTMGVALPGETDMVLLDVPLLRDDDNTLGHYVAATSSSTTWPGASIQRSQDDITYAEAAVVSERAVMGLTTTVLGTWAGGNIFDEVNSVTVNVGAGTLSSSTRTAMLEDSTINAMMVGGELIRFRTATGSAGVYVLSGLLRGLKGTEWAVGTHIIGDQVVLMQTQGLRYVGIDLPSLNAERFYRGVTRGRALSTADADAFTCEGVSLKPLAPVHLRASRNPATGDVDFTWSRRTRLATTFCGPAGIVVPLGEASEVYKVRVYSDAGMTLLLRTIDSTEEAATYTAAQISADGGAFRTVFYAQVRQVGVASIEGYARSGGFSLPLVPPDVLSSYRPTSRVVFGEFDGDLVAMDAGPDGSAIVHRTLTSSDDGITFAVSQSGAVVTGYPSGVTSWVVASSTRRLCIIYNQAAAIRLMSYVDDNTSTPTEINPGPVASGASLVPFAVAVDGVTPFVLIARPLALPFGSDFYVYTSATGTTWTLVGQLQQDGGDTNVLSPGSLGAFEALSFSPDYPAYQNANLMLIGTRWFLIGSLAIYYTDDAAAETNWFRAPTGLGEGATSPTTSIGGMAEIGSRLIAYRVFTYANLATPSVSVSADAGATWTAYRPTEQGTAELTEMFLHNGYVYLSAPTTSDPRFIRSSTGLSGSWSVVSGTGVAGSLTEFRSAGGNILASNVVTVGGTTVRQIVYSADDGATWQVSTIS